MRRRLGVALCAVATVAVLGGCGNSASGGPAAPGPGTTSATAGRPRAVNPCTLPTPQEIAAALTQPAQDPDSAGLTAVIQCTWWSKSGDRYVGVQLAKPHGLSDIPEGFGWTRERFDEYRGSDEHAVSGVGDAAWFRVDKESGNLDVLKGSFAFTVFLDFLRAKDRPAEDSLLATLRTLAIGIASRQ